MPPQLVNKTNLRYFISKHQPQLHVSAKTYDSILQVVNTRLREFVYVFQRYLRLFDRNNRTRSRMLNVGMVLAVIPDAATILDVSIDDYTKVSKGVLGKMLRSVLGVQIRAMALVVLRQFVAWQVEWIVIKARGLVTLTKMKTLTPEHVLAVEETCNKNTAQYFKRKKPRRRIVEEQLADDKEEGELSEEEEEPLPVAQAAAQIIEVGEKELKELQEQQAKVDEMMKEKERLRAIQKEPLPPARGRLAEGGRRLARNVLLANLAHNLRETLKKAKETPAERQARIEQEDYTNVTPPPVQPLYLPTKEKEKLIHEIRRLQEGFFRREYDETMITRMNTIDKQLRQHSDYTPISFAILQKYRDFLTFFERFNKDKRFPKEPGSFISINADYEDMIQLYNQLHFKDKLKVPRYITVPDIEAYNKMYNYIWENKDDLDRRGNAYKNIKEDLDTLNELRYQLQEAHNIKVPKVTSAEVRKLTKKHVRKNKPLQRPPRPRRRK